MALTWPWLTLALLAVAAAALGLWWRRPHRARGDLLVAGSARLLALPRFARLARWRSRLAAAQVLGVLLVLAGGALLAGRPAEVETVAPEGRSRDVMLCLDVSSSMDPFNLQVVEEFRALSEELADERIGLTVWSGTAVTVFPLTEDHVYVGEQLDLAAEAIRTYDFGFVAGTFNEEERSSLVGDGLVSCVQRFDRPEDERGRAIVLATDNDPQGEPVYSLAEAAAVAAEADVRVYAIGVDVMPPGAPEELATAAESTGGQMFVLGSQESAAGIVAGIQELEEARLDGPVQAVRRDLAWPGAALAGAGVAVLGLSGLAGLRRPGGGAR